MRMTQGTGTTAADLVNFTHEKGIADLIYQLGEEGGAEDSQSNRPSTAHTEHIPSGRCGVAGRA